MAIRFVDKTGRVGSIRAALEAVSAELIGSHAAPPARSGSLATQLDGMTGLLAGLVSAGRNRAGQIISALDGVTMTATGTASAPGASGGIKPAAGFAVSISGSVITITGPPGSFGTKPYDPRPLLWAPMSSSRDPSPLGRISGSNVWVQSGGLSWVATGGPNGRGCASGIGSPAPGTTGSANWTLGFDINSWSGWAAQKGSTGYYLNDFGQALYIYRLCFRNTGHLDFLGAKSFNGIAGYNVKIARLWATGGTVGSAQALPDIYLASSNQDLSVENKTGGLLSPDYPSNGGGIQYGTLTTAAMAARDNQTNTWFSEELVFTSNSDNATKDANFNYYVHGITGPFAGGSLYNFPVTTYATMAQVYLNSTVSQTIGGVERGTMLRAYPCHEVVDADSGSGRPPAPAGMYVAYADVYVDDSKCRGDVRDNAVRPSLTKMAIQVPTAWSDTSVSFAYPLNLGPFGSLAGLPFVVTDETGAERVIGTCV